MAELRLRFTAATLDGEREITARFNHRLPEGDWPVERFRLTGGDGRRVEIVSVSTLNPRRGQAAAFTLTTAAPLDFTAEQFTLEIEGLGAHVVRPWRVVHGDERYHDPDAELGATYSPQRTVFRVFAPTALAVKVVVADQAEGPAGVADYPMTRGPRGVWEAVVEGDLAGRFYAYKLSGPGFVEHAEIRDIYAVCTQNRAPRSLIVDLRATDPPGFREHECVPLASPVDAVIWETHVRDFSIAPSSGIRAKGRYLGMTETGTRLPAAPDVRTGLDHLVELGVTHVQLMPVQDFDNDESAPAYDWGYMPVSFNSPEGWYAGSIAGPARIRELKQLIQALHERGIGVILDVVYNHTSERATFEQLVPGYYYRMTADGRFHNGSGCGNELNTENPMARKFIIDSMSYWVREYRIDGFRIDLMGLYDLETLRRIRDALTALHPGLLIYGEPWAGGPTPLRPVSDHAQVRGTGLGAFNDRFRDAIKGGRDDYEPGYIQAGRHPEGIVHGLMGSVHDWSIHPTDTVNYFETHDNLTAWDKLLVSTPDVPDAVRRRMMRLASLILLTSQGAVLLHGGQEFCRRKKGCSNSYNQPDSINQINWGLKVACADVCDYVKALIAIRRSHPAFRLRTREAVEARVGFDRPPHNQAIVHWINAHGLAGETVEQLRVLLNGSGQEVTFDLPAGTWKVLADADRADPGGLREVAGQVTAPPHGGLLLCR